MLFSSIVFLFAFLPAVLALNFILPARARNSWLLVASLFFYAWGEPRLISVMLASIGFNYAMGLVVERTHGTRWCKGWVVASVVGNLGLIAYFKYFNFFTESWNGLAAACGLPPLATASVVLPIGISFYTFQALSYVIDVYRGEVPAQRNPFSLGLYVAFFPQLIAGPIVRYSEVAKELKDRTVTAAAFAQGIERFLIGLSKKVLVANIMALAADAVFSMSPAELTTPLAWGGMLAYALQIYFDFSGYSDMAIGLGRMFGFHFPENFNYPYSATSVTDFWRRWHMSLSSWFRDYLYVPLGGNRCGAIRTYCNLAIVFVFCGLWHGASWVFVLWGALHGAFLIAERLAEKFTSFQPPRWIGQAYTMLAVLFAWVLFRAEGLAHAGYYYTALLGQQAVSSQAFKFESVFDTGTMVMMGIACLLAVPWRREVGALLEMAPVPASSPTSPSLRAILMDSLSFATLMAGFLACTFRLLSQSHNPFIYFRF